MYHWIGSYTVDNNTNLIQVNEPILEKAAIKTIKYITDDKYRERNVNMNFEIGRDHYSMQTLRLYLERLIEEFD